MCIYIRNFSLLWWWCNDIPNSLISRCTVRCRWDKLFIDAQCRALKIDVLFFCTFVWGEILNFLSTSSFMKICFSFQTEMLKFYGNFPTVSIRKSLMTIWKESNDHWYKVFNNLTIHPPKFDIRTNETRL
jgi:hypothetical protein